MRNVVVFLLFSAFWYHTSFFGGFVLFSVVCVCFCFIGRWQKGLMMGTTASRPLPFPVLNRKSVSSLVIGVKCQAGRSIYMPHPIDWDRDISFYHNPYPVDGVFLVYLILLHRCIPYRCYLNRLLSTKRLLCFACMAFMPHIVPVRYRCSLVISFGRDIITGCKGREAFSEELIQPDYCYCLTNSFFLGTVSGN